MIAQIGTNKLGIIDEIGKSGKCYLALRSLR